MARADLQKFFGSFFQKRTAFFLCQPPSGMVLLCQPTHLPLLQGHLPECGDNLVFLVGLGKKQAAIGQGASIYPDVRMIMMGDHRSRMQAASFMPSMPRGMSMSVNTIRMSLRASRMRTASVASAASTASNPALSTMSTAAILRSGSSSTTRMIVLAGGMIVPAT
jgi:hypothetical protein